MADQLRRPKEGSSEQNEAKSTTCAAQDGGLKNSLHGVAYQLKLLLIVVLQAGRLMRDDSCFTCTVSTEDPDDGKFDDIVFRYRYRGLERVLSIQAKHKSSHEQKISWQDLAINSTNAPFAILKYFVSFLEQKERDVEAEQRLVLCTNAGLLDGVKQALRVQDTSALNQNDLCYIFKLIESTCYCFNTKDAANSSELQRIVGMLKESSDCYGLGKLLANAVYNGQRLDLNTRNVQRSPLLVKYRHGIVCHVLGEKRQKTTHHLKEEFCDGTVPSGVRNLRNVFELEYRKLAGDVADIWTDVRAKGITLKEDLKSFKVAPPETDNSSLPEDLVTDEIIEEFFEKFLLVCGSRSEDELSQTVMDFWQQTYGTELSTNDIDNGDKTAAYNEMLRVVFDWMKEQKQPPVPLTNGDIEMLLDRIGFGSTYPELRCASRIHVDSMELDKYRINLRPQRVAQSTLYEFLCQKQAPTIFSYHSQFDLKYVAVVVMETIRVFQAFQKEYGSRYETVFLNRAMFWQSRKTIKAILKLKNIRIVFVILCEDGGEEILGKMGKYNRSSPEDANDSLTKIILIEKLRNGSRDNVFDGHFVVSDLTEDSREQMCPAKKTVRLFGTEVPLRQMIDGGDNLTKSLEIIDSLGAIEREPCLVEVKYNEIRDWYIQRYLRPYSLRRTDSMWSKKFLVPSYFKLDERMEFGVFYDTLKRHLRINLFDDWHMKYIVEGYDRGTEINSVEMEADSTPATKVFVVLDEAGFGKSTYLTWLASYLQRKNPSRWVVRFNAIEYSSDFEQILKRNSTIGAAMLHAMGDTQALRILFQLVHLSLFVGDIRRKSCEETDRERVRAEHSASLLQLQGGRIVLDNQECKLAHLTAIQRIELKLFQHKYNSEQLVILFDGFDEVVPYYKDVVYRLFARWQAFKGIHKIYLTSRPYELKSEFEAVFRDNVQFYQLMPFNKDTRLVSILIFLRSNFPKYGLCGEAARYDLLGSLEAIVRCYLAELRNTPLFVRMGLDILCPLVQEHVDFEHGTISCSILNGINTNLEKLRMVETFVQNKLSIANVEKVQTTDAVRKTAYALDNTIELNRWTHRMHSALALYVLFGAEQRQKLLSEREETEALEYMEKVRHGSVKSGLIEGVVGLVPLFIHRTFVEYFAADWVYRHMRAGDTAFAAVNPKWFGSPRVEVSEFYDRMLIRDASGTRPLHLAAINRSLVDIKMLLKEYPERALEKDAGGRTFLHLLVLYTNDAHFKRHEDDFYGVFYELRTVSVNCCDQLRGWSALDYAFVLGYSTFVRYLIFQGASVNVDTLLRQLMSHGDSVEKVLHLAMYYEKIVTNFRFTATSKRYMSEVPRQIAEYLVREKQLDIGQELSEDAWRCHRTVLGSCVETDAPGLFRCLIELAGGIRKVPVERLLRKAIVEQAVHVINYLVVVCGCELPANLGGRGIIWVLNRCIECRYKELFDILLGRFSERKRNYAQKFLRLSRSWFLTTDAEQPDEYYETKQFEPWNFRDFPPIDPYILRLLCTAVASGSKYALKNLLLVLAIPVDNELIISIMETIVDKPVHERSHLPLIYLIDKSPNLQKPDKHRRPLLQVAIESGWTDIAIYLIERKGFNTKKAPFWCAAQQSFRLHSWVQEDRVRLFRYLKEKYPPEHVLFAHDEQGQTVLERAVGNYHFIIAKIIVESAPRPTSDPDTPSTLVCSVLEEANLTEKEECYHFLEWLIKESDRKDVYRDAYELLREEPYRKADNQSPYKHPGMAKPFVSDGPSRFTVVRRTTGKGAAFMYV